MSDTHAPQQTFRRQVSASIPFVSKGKRLKRIRISTGATSNYLVSDEYIICGTGDANESRITIRSENGCAKKTVVTNSGAGSLYLYEDGNLVGIIASGKTWVSPCGGVGVFSARASIGTSLSITTYVVGQCSMYSGSGGINGGFEI